VSRYIEEHRSRFGVEPVCEALGVSASAYYERRSGRRSARTVEDERLLEVIKTTHAKNFYAYGSLRSAGVPVDGPGVDRTPAVC
jgi:putative transposase